MSFSTNPPRKVGELPPHFNVLPFEQPPEVKEMMELTKEYYKEATKYYKTMNEQLEEEVRQREKEKKVHEELLEWKRKVWEEEYKNTKSRVRKLTKVERDILDPEAPPDKNVRIMPM
jgi:phosphate uptake regulator